MKERDNASRELRTLAVKPPKGSKLQIKRFLNAVCFASAAGLISGCVATSTRLVADPISNLNGRLVSERVSAGSWMRHVNGDSRLIYVSDWGSNDVTVYDSDAQVVGEIASLGGPEGLFVDQNHDLWVANSNQADVLEFARGGTSPIRTLKDPMTRPDDLTICPDKTIYVSNAGEGPGSGNIAVYPAGKTSPVRTLSSLGVNSNDWITCDAAGNVFSMVVIGSAVPTVGVIEYLNGREAHQRGLAIEIQYPGGIKSETNGDLLITDGRTVTEYTEAGAPTGRSILTPFFAEDIAVSKDGSVAGGTGIHLARSWTFPGGKLRRNFKDENPPSTSMPSGFAFDPEQL